MDSFIFYQDIINYFLSIFSLHFVIVWRCGVVHNILKNSEDDLSTDHCCISVSVESLCVSAT